MKKAIAGVIALTLVFAFASLSFAAGKKAAVQQVRGEVSAVDTTANTITVKGKKGDVTISVNDKTKIMAGTEKKALADIKVGDKVTVKYTEADGKNIAKSIDRH